MVRHVKPSDYVDAKDYVAQVEDTPLTKAVDAYLATEPGTEAALLLAERCRCIMHGQKPPTSPVAKRDYDKRRREMKKAQGICVSCKWPALPGQRLCFYHRVKHRLHARISWEKKQCNCQQTQMLLPLSDSESSSESGSSSPALIPFRTAS